MDDVIVSDEARRRIDSARLRQVAFQIKQSAPTLSGDDAEALAYALLEHLNDPSKEIGMNVRQVLMRRGRSRDAADRLARIIGL